MHYREKMPSAMLFRSKLLRIFLFACLLLPFISVYLLLQHQKSVLKQEVKKHLLQGDLQLPLSILKFSKAQNQQEINWEQPGEFEYRSKMYDVVQMKVVGDTVVYWCLEDTEETEINEKLLYFAIDLEDGEEDDDKKRELTNFLKKLYIQTSFIKKAVSVSGKIVFSSLPHFPVSNDRTPPFLPPERI